MAAAGKPKVADAARCRRHPSHRHAAGVCPFCLSDRLSRLSAASDASATTSSSSACSSGAASVAPCRGARRARLGTLMRQEETDTDTGSARHGGQLEEKAPAPAPAEEIKKPAKRSTFWARLQRGRSWYGRRDGCSVAHSSKAAKRAPLF